jgi:predicted dehydrogenase
MLEHLPAIRAAGTYEIKAVYSRSKKSAEALITDGSVDVYSDDSGPGKGLEDLLERKDIQAVDVVLPITHQPEVIKKALKAGKHVVSFPPQKASN